VKFAMDNICPICGKGVISCKPTEAGWLDSCSDCSFHKLHHNRREKQIKIDFPDRRKEGINGSI
jgi:hypothetical protein